MKVTTSTTSHGTWINDRRELSREFLSSFLTRGFKGCRGRLGELKRLLKARIKSFHKAHKNIEDGVKLLKGPHRAQLLAFLKGGACEPYTKNDLVEWPPWQSEVDAWVNSMTDYIRIYICQGMNPCLSQEVLREHSPASSPELSLPEDVHVVKRELPDFETGIAGEGVAGWFLGCTRNPAMLVESRRTLVATVDHLNAYLNRDVKTVHVKSFPVKVPDFSLNVLATALFRTHNMGIGGIPEEEPLSDDEDEVDYTEKKTFDCWDTQLDRFAHPAKMYSGEVPKDLTSEQAIAHHAHERTVERLVFQMMLIGLPEEGIELTDENISLRKTALNSGGATKIQDLPQKVLIDVLLFVVLQAKDRHTERHNLQAAVLVNSAENCGEGS